MLFRFVAKAVVANLEDGTKFICASSELNEMVGYLAKNNLLKDMPAEVRAIASTVKVHENTPVIASTRRAKTGKFVQLLYVNANKELCVREIKLKKGQSAQEVALKEANDPDNGVYGYKETSITRGQREESLSTTYFGQHQLRIAVKTTTSNADLRRMIEQLPADVADVCTLTANHRTVVSGLSPNDRVIDFKGNQRFPAPSAKVG